MRLFRRLAISACLLLLVAGMASGGFRLAMHLAPEYRQTLIERLEAVLRAEVEIQDLRLAWAGWGPSIALQRVRVQGSEPIPIQVEALQIGFDLWSLLRGEPKLSRLTVVGANLMLYQDVERWRVQGLPGAAEGAPVRDPLAGLKDFSEIRIRDSVLLIQPEAAATLGPYTVAELSLQRRSAGQEVRVQILDQGQGQLTGLLRLRDGELKSAEFELTNLDLAAITRKLPAVAAWPPLRVARLSGKVDQFDDPEGRALWRAELQSQLQAGGGLRAIQANAPLSIRAGPEYLRVESKALALETAGESWPTQLAWLEWVRGAAGGIRGQFEYLNLDSAWAFMSQYWPEQTQGTSIQGDLSDVTLDWSQGAPRPDMIAQFSRLGIARGAELKLSGLSGEVSSSGLRGRVAINSRDIRLDWPARFERSVAIESLSGTADWAGSGEALQFEVPDLAYALAGVDGVGRVSREANGSWTTELRFLSPDAAEAKGLMPTNWPESLREWLGVAIQSAEVRSGRLYLVGQREKLRHTELDLDIGQANINYAPGWEPLIANRANVRLRDRELSIGVPDGELGGVQLSKLRADLGENPAGLLRITANLSGDGGKLLGVLSRSPVSRPLKNALADLRLRGSTSAELGIDVNLQKRGDVRWVADIAFDQAELKMRGWPDPVTRLNGRVNVDANGLRGQGLSARMLNWPISISAQRSAGRSRIRAQGQADLAQIPATWPLPAWLRTRLGGRADMVLEAAFGGDRAPLIELRSDMIGAAVALPPPMAKPPDQAQRLNLRYRPASRELKLDYGQIVALSGADFGLPSARLALRFGGEAVVSPSAPGLWLDGVIGRVQVEPWIDLIGEFGDDSKGPGFGALNLTLGSLRLAEQQWMNQSLQVLKAGDNWVINLRGDSLRGQLLATPRENASPVFAGQFERADWVMDRSDKAGGLELPATLPPLDVRVSRFLLNDEDLGALTLAISPLESGYRVETLRVGQDRDPTLVLSGDVYHQPATSPTQSRMEFVASTGNAGAWLRALGYQDMLDADSMQLSGTLGWSGPEALAKMAFDGEIEFSFEDGRLLSVDPGAGRLLGLLSVSALPRRLLLDFSDLTDDGLAFDKVRGRYTLAGGKATSQGMEIDGPSLRLQARGEIDLVTRQQDQIVTIYPGISHGMTAAATVLAGPAIGLFMLVAQELLDKPLDQVSQVSYRLSGPFDNPKVDALQ